MSGRTLHSAALPRPSAAGEETTSCHKDRKETRRSEIPNRIKEAVRGLEPGAEVILYGSRARGDAQPDSDWDLLILVDGSVDRQREQVLFRRLYHLELDLEEILCPVVVSRKDWGSPLFRAMPFHKDVDRDGIVL